MDKAKEILTEAEDAFKQNHFGMSVNRSYYAIFTSARALLAMKEMDSSKHSGVISLFNQHIVKAGNFPTEFSKFFREAKEIREDADYGDFVKITGEDARNQIDNAQRFVEEAEKALSRMM
jgi:uncharacterized protein (UPF0332 family)